MSRLAKNVYVGSFLNLSALCDKLKQDGSEVLLFCAGWKDKYNLEDTLFAGAVAEELADLFHITDDATLAAMDLYTIAKGNLNAYLQKASHVNRFKSLHIETDLDVCLKINSLSVLPVYKDGSIQI